MFKIFKIKKPDLKAFEVWASPAIKTGYVFKFLPFVPTIESKKFVPQI